MPDNSKRYIGITLGPICQMIGKAEKTREFWAASYLFSYLSRRLIEAFQGAGLRVLNPSPEGLPIAAGTRPGVGLYSDRIYLAGGAGDFNKVLVLIEKEKKELARQIEEDIRNYRGLDPIAYSLAREVSRAGKQSALGERLPEFLNHYFQVYSVELGEQAITQIEDGKKSWFQALNVYLNQLELRASLSHFDPDPVKVFLRAANHTFLLKDAFTRKQFDSLIEIATNGLRFIGEEGSYPFRQEYDRLVAVALEKAIATRREELEGLPEKSEESDVATEEEEELLAQIFKISGAGPYLRTYHRYVATVRADADRLGQLIGTLSEDEMEAFTRALLAFSREANELIAGKKYTHDDKDDWGYGGSPVYIGGDDLVFFAPVATVDGKAGLRSIFHLIQDIDESFHRHFAAYSQANLSLSYGVAITYYKYPLQEAYALSGELLDAIKGNEPRYKSRNRINFMVQKHSGQDFGGILNNNFPEALEKFLILIGEHGVKPPEGRKAGRFVNSITHQLAPLHGTIAAVAANRESLQAFFDKNFDEPIHDQFRDYLNSVCKFIHQLFTDYLSEKRADGQPLVDTKELADTIYGLLRFIHFIRDDEFKDQ